MKAIYHFSRLLLGLTFVFSGFVKGQDPLGTTFKIEDYFVAYGWEWAMPYALILSILLCTFEFALGAGLLLNLQFRLVSWLTAALMVFFTGLTLYDAIYNPVPDCGCFGDAIKLTNWQTFWKNVVLLVFVVLMFYSRRKAKLQPNRLNGQFLTLVVLASFFTLFSYWAYTNLPVFDFLPWKKGNRLYAEETLPVQYFVSYRNNTTGEIREYPADNFPFNDPVWMSEWTFASSRVFDPNVAIRHELVIVDSFGDDVTETDRRNPDYQFIITLYNPHKASPVTLERISALARKIESTGHSVIILTTALAEEIAELRRTYHWTEDVFNADDIALKMMVRANPGLVLLKDGIVINKWNGRNLPDFEAVQKKYFVAATVDD